MTENYMLVAAIDFGTTYSGYAFSMKSTFEKEPLKIHTNQAWNAGGRQLLSLKTPTCLLLNSEKELDAFGYEAENKYAELVMDGDHKDYYYFHRFKMSLHNNKNVSSDMVLEDITGKTVPALDVFALSIKALVIHLQTALENKGTGMRATDILWVLTVPAIWTDNAKQFMRKSAEMAGIQTDYLLISLEPEAASVYCQYLPTEKLSGSSSGFTVFKPGTKYMIIDLGGGTADITVHEKLENGRLKELCRASGGDCGGTSVDSAFIQMMAKIIGAPLINKIKLEEPEIYLDLIREFETVKRSVTSSKTGKVNMAIPYITIDELCKTHLEEPFISALSTSKYANDISVRYDKLRIAASFFKTLFGETITNIIKLITETLKQTDDPDVNYLLLVGGFSECTLIQETVRKEFPSCKVLVPEESGLAVLRGAVLFGHKPAYIASRRSRCTYGIACDPKFDPSIHDQKRSEVINGERRCKDAFDIIMQKGKSASIGTIFKKTYKSNVDYNVICFRVFTTDKYNPVYVDEDGCNLLGSAEIDIPDASEEHDLEVEVTFGNTEISLKAVDTDTGNQCDANFRLI